MSNPQPEKSRPENEPETQQDTVDLTTGELRTISGGVFLNIVVEKPEDKKGEHPHLHPHHGKH